MNDVMEEQEIRRMAIKYASLAGQRLEQIDKLQAEVARLQSRLDEAEKVIRPLAQAYNEQQAGPENYANFADYLPVPLFELSQAAAAWLERAGGE